MSEQAKSLWRKYASWERSFRKAARADNYVVFKEHLERLRDDEDYYIYRFIDKSYEYYYEICRCENQVPVPGTPESMLESTISAVQAVVSYANLNQADWVGKAISEFLAMQEYDPVKLTGSHYVLTFDIENSLARLLVDCADFAPVDLADLYSGSPGLEGLRKILVSHSDWSPLTKAELKSLEQYITHDFRCDYAGYELALDFEPDFKNASYLVTYLVEDYEPAGTIIKKWNKAIRANPKEPEAYLSRGLVYRYQGEFKRAIRDFNKAICLNPKDAWSYSQRAIAYLGDLRPEAAIRDIDEALRLDPNADAGLEFGGVFRDGGRVGEFYGVGWRQIQKGARRARRLRRDSGTGKPTERR